MSIVTRMRGEEDASSMAAEVEEATRMWRRLEAAEHILHNVHFSNLVERRSSPQIKLRQKVAFELCLMGRLEPEKIKKLGKMYRK